MIILCRGDKDEKKKRKRYKDDQVIYVFKMKLVKEIVLDDGYKWRKYGKKLIRGNLFLR